MRIPPLLSDILLVLRWTLIHLAVFGFCSYTAIDQAYEESWPEYSLIARILALPMSAVEPYRIPFVLSNSLIWGLAALVLRKISKSQIGDRLTRAFGILFIWGGFYTFLLRGFLYLLGRDYPIAHRDDLLRNHPLSKILGFPTVQISEWFEIPFRLPLTFCVGVVWGALFLVAWKWRRGANFKK
ncbi:MAG: hypothetical protein KC944_15365 [Candidatus Omnitrophica bacterium]|nr:hypothetical protein [Candidatus Omnitrophota bacterium]